MFKSFTFALSLEHFCEHQSAVIQLNIKQGDNVEVSIDLESREYNGRWYTDVKAWKVSLNGTNADSSYSPNSQDYYDTLTENLPNLGEDIIPF